MSRKRRSIAKRWSFVGLGGLAVSALFVAGLALTKGPPEGSGATFTPQPLVTPSMQRHNLDPLREAMKTGAPITVYGLGSSVGVGATLPDAATQAPSAYLTSKLAPLSTGGSTVTNLSANGSVASEGVAIYRDKVKPQHPTVLVLAYGMNDGLAGSFNAGQTFPGGISAVRTIASEAMADGTTVLLATTPSPHTGRTNFGMPAGVTVRYPQVGGEALPTEPVVEVSGAPFSNRHNEFNKELVKLGSEFGANVLDAAAPWAAAVAQQGEDAFFDAKETVHPNLAGHTVSYWAAIDAFAASLKP